MSARTKPKPEQNGHEPVVIERQTIQPELTLEEAGFIYQMIQGSTLPYSTVALAQGICAKLEALAPSE